MSEPLSARAALPAGGGRGVMPLFGFSLEEVAIDTEDELLGELAVGVIE